MTPKAEPTGNPPEPESNVSDATMTQPDLDDLKLVRFVISEHECRIGWIPQIGESVLEWCRG